MCDKEIELNSNKFNKEMEQIEEKMDGQLDEQI